MPDLGLNGAEFRGLAAQLLAGGHGVRFQAAGESMQPFIRNGDILEVASIAGTNARLGDVLLVEAGGRLLAHRVVKTKWKGRQQWISIKGDACSSPDGWFSAGCILGRVTAVERAGQRSDLMARGQRVKSWLWAACTPLAPAFRWLPAAVKDRMKRMLF